MRGPRDALFSWGRVNEATVASVPDGSSHLWGPRVSGQRTPSVGHPKDACRSTVLVNAETLVLRCACRWSCGVTAPSVCEGT